MKPQGLGFIYFLTAREEQIASPLFCIKLEDFVLRSIDGRFLAILILTIREYENIIIIPPIGGV